VVVLVLADQVKGQKPFGQRQLRGVEEGAGAQGRLPSAAHTRSDRLALDEEGGMRPLTAGGTDQSVGPAGMIQISMVHLLLRRLA